MSRTYIVTGAAGFIGSHLCAALLDRGDHVVGIDNFDPFYDEAVKRANIVSFDPDRFRLVEADIRDRKVIQETIEQAGPAVVFHIAALAGVRASIADPARHTSVNVSGTVSLLEAMRAGDCRRLVLASSSSVYGNNEKIPFSESDPVMGQISP
ncbi:MAG: GDP-mannose 4,6-dehydratase, partial [Planctomycetes bacterium]|nr:GDP-mannose 4,6-dehydratase [Planctomycetota bacterium]